MDVYVFSKATGVIISYRLSIPKSWKKKKLYVNGMECWEDNKMYGIQLRIAGAKKCKKLKVEYRMNCDEKLYRAKQRHSLFSLSYENFRIQLG